MSLSNNKFQLSNGNSIPAVAYGVGTKWFKFGRNELDANVVNAIKSALAKGFVHIDGAEIYNTNGEIGEAIAGLDRKNVFLTDKYFSGDLSHTRISPHGKPYDSLKHSLQNELKVDYVDLYLLHAPFISKESHGFDLAEAWKSMEQAQKEGLTKNIGVSNFAVKDLEEILLVAEIKPVVNQIEFNAYLQNQTPGIVEFSQKNGILVEAYSPLAPLVKGEKGEFTDYLDTLASKYNKLPSQILLRWVLERGVLPVTTSGNEERQSQLVNIFDFSLTPEEVEKIKTLGEKHPTLRQYWTKEYSKYD